MSVPQYSARSSLGFALSLATLGWGLYQSFWNLGAANLNADEPIYREAGWAYVHGDFALNREHPPVAKYLIGLAQLVFGHGELGPRIAAASTVVLGAAILYLWLRLEIGRAGALFAAGAWMLLPHGVSSGVRLDRFGLLEPFMVFFAIAAFASAWRWFRTRSWWWLVLSAVAMALSVGSKVSTAVTIPAILLLPLLAKRIRDTLLGAVVFVAVFGAVFVLAYLPMGIRSALTSMLQMQSAHDAAGHLVVVAGVATAFPPWWANLLFSVEGMGIAASLMLVIGTGAAFFRRPPGLALPLYIGTALALLLVFYLVVSRVALTHYYYAWVWLLCVLAGIGVSVLLGRRRSSVATVLTRTLAGAVVALGVACAVWTSVAVANERAEGMALVLPTLDELGVDVDSGEVLVSGMADWEYLPYLDGRQTLDAADPDIVAVAVKDSLRFPESPQVGAFLEANASELDEIVIDDVRLYVREEQPVG
ncbi:glycosyltransferase family 39 protein [Herbiconiux sp. YIM B11900]|uniref:glycosyltransferase family 39 protein n=1 Tax=Herbiconiux sp. YIM B11900 TaxID=3404131 RepID=UPI003F863190